ncbi:MAG: hypothetical protein Q8O15_08870 [Rectinemataceae bacterium]|nr:hypothetical protein [Rectinemataceae bacterium]
MRSVHILDTFTAERSTARKRSRASAPRAHLKNEQSAEKTLAAMTEMLAKRLLVVIESEGTVFDSLSRKHEKAYLPAFAGCFSWGSNPAVCSSLWHRLALRSRLRGQEPLRILLSALQLLNRAAPSIRRVAVIRALETYLTAAKPDPLSLASYPKGSPERLILDWIAMSDSLLEEEGYAPSFEAAARFLQTITSIAPGAEILVHSSCPEAIALNQWEMAGLGNCFLRIAGSERGNFAAYLRTALKSGYDKAPILVIGTSASAWQAAQSVAARFYPIMPEAEEECWKFLLETYLPAFMRGESFLAMRDSTDFMRLMLEDIDCVEAQ